MTAQSPEAFDNQHPRVNLSGRQLYAIAVGEVGGPRGHYGWSPYQPQTQPNACEAGCSANWSGYCAYYRLTADGKLCLDRYSYQDGQPDTVVGEYFAGDFHLVMREDFYAPNLYIPFVDGRIVEDVTQWRLPGFRSLMDEATNDYWATAEHKALRADGTILWERSEVEPRYPFGSQSGRRFWLFVDGHLQAIEPPWEALTPGHAPFDEALRELCIDPGDTNARLRDPTPRPSSICFSPHHYLMAATSHELRVWATPTMNLEMRAEHAWGYCKFTNDIKLVTRFNEFILVFGDDINAVIMAGGRLHEGCFAADPSGRWLVIGQREHVLVVDLESPTRPHTCWTEHFQPLHGIRDVSFSPDGTHLITAGNDGLRVYRWDDVLRERKRTLFPDALRSWAEKLEFWDLALERWHDPPDTAHRWFYRDTTCSNLVWDSANRLLFSRNHGYLSHPTARLAKADEICRADLPTGGVDVIHDATTFAQRICGLCFSADQQVLGCQLAGLDPSGLECTTLQLLDYERLATGRRSA